MTGNMPDRRCGNCKHYTSQRDRCHRYPPVPFDTNGGSRWPVVVPTDTCGEWDTWRLAPVPEPEPEPKYGAATAEMLDAAKQNGRLEERGDVVAWLTEAQFHVVSQEEVQLILRVREQFRRGRHQRGKP